MYEKYKERGGRPVFHPADITYVRNLRITKAKQMLRFTDKKLEDIGYRCGLGTLHYFSRIFRQGEGITPSEFREKWGEAGR